jgi:hypothetical protein
MSAVAPRRAAPGRAPRPRAFRRGPERGYKSRHALNVARLERSQQADQTEEKSGAGCLTFGGQGLAGPGLTPANLVGYV